MEVTTRASILCAGSILVSVLGACGSSDFIILGPTPPDEGIVIYIHRDYAGSSQAINVDVRDLDRVEGPCSEGAEGEVPSPFRPVDYVPTFVDYRDLGGGHLVATA